MSVNPFIKWPGGKARVWQNYLSYIMYAGDYGRYHEPFVGGGAVWLGVNPETAVLADFNWRLLDTYRAIQIDAVGVINKLNQLQEEYERYDLDGREQMYYRLRHLFNDAGSHKGLTISYFAALFIFLNKAGFNGLYRENKAGLFNVPFGDGRNKQFCDMDNLLQIAERLRNATLVVGDFEDITIMYRPRPGDLVYFDPPYIPLNSDSFTNYNGGGFGRKDHERLAELCHKLDGNKVLFMASNSDTPLTRELYERWAGTTYQIKAARSVNSDGNGRGKVGELVITNYPTNQTRNPELARGLLI